MPDRTVAGGRQPSPGVPAFNSAAGPLIDLGRALDLLAAAVEERGPHFAGSPDRDGVNDGDRSGDRQPGLAERALELQGVSTQALEQIRHSRLRDMFAHHRLPVPLTLGAVIVLDAAQRSQERGRTWADSVDDARQVALRFFDVLPSAAFA